MVSPLAKRFVNLRNKLESQWQEAGRGASAMENWTTLVSTDKLPPPAATLIESPPAAGTAQTDNPWLDGNDATWLGAWQTRPAPLRCITDGNATSLAVSVARRQRDDSQHWLAAAVLVALAIFAVAALRTGLADAAYSRWPQLAGVALGLAWWLLLWPSVLGLVIVAASLIASVRPGWKRRRTSGSVIVPISTVHR